jgi:Lon protease-like protein
MAEFVQVNFARPLPLFPLPQTVLLPHSVQPLHIFEPRYRQMVEHALDGAGQIAMACFDGHRYKTEYEKTPPIRPAVCIGQIVHHDSLAGGRHNIVLHGVCRARITSIENPAADRLYRRAVLRPIEVVPADPPPMNSLRRRMKRLLQTDALQKLRGASAISECFDRDDVSTHALLELVGSTLISDFELQYRLLAERSMKSRADIILSELTHLQRIVRLASAQKPGQWPKGMSWN